MPWGAGHSGPRSPDEPALLTAFRTEFHTPLDRFGPSRHVYGRVHQAVSGVYLLVAPHFGAENPVFAAGWARNDYWAVRVWGFSGYGYRNDYDPLEAAADEPSLASLGWPHPLSYAETFARAATLSEKPVMVSAKYRMTDGAFTSHQIHAAPRVKFHYDDPNPEPTDTVAAIELRLGGDRWEQYLAEIRAINRENERHNPAPQRTAPISPASFTTTTFTDGTMLLGFGALGSS